MRVTGSITEENCSPTSVAPRGPRSEHPHHPRPCPKSLETLARDTNGGAEGPSLPPHPITMASGTGGRKLVSCCPRNRLRIRVGGAGGAEARCQTLGRNLGLDLSSGGGSPALTFPRGSPDALLCCLAVLGADPTLESFKDIFSNQRFLGPKRDLLIRIPKGYALNIYFTNSPGGSDVQPTLGATCNDTKTPLQTNLYSNTHNTRAVAMRRRALSSGTRISFPA